MLLMKLSLVLSPDLTSALKLVRVSGIEEYGGGLFASDDANTDRKPFMVVGGAL